MSCLVYTKKSGDSGLFMFELDCSTCRMVFFTVRLHFPNSVYQDMCSYGFLMEGMVFGCELLLEEQF